METEDKIKMLAEQFKNVILQMDAEDFSDSEWLLEFPRGCCGDVCNLFSKFLIQNGIDTEYVTGNRGLQTHAWLEYGNLIIDITAYQFPEVDKQVLITRDRSWHKEFKEQKRNYNEDFEEFESDNKNRLRTIYNNILKKISKMNF